MAAKKKTSNKPSNVVKMGDYRRPVVRNKEEPTHYSVPLSASEIEEFRQQGVPDDEIPESWQRPLPAAYRISPPIHKVGDRVVNFRGDSTGIIESVHPSGNPGSSHKVRVRLDSGHSAFSNEQVWEPHTQDATVIPFNKGK